MILLGDFKAWLKWRLSKIFFRVVPRKVDAHQPHGVNLIGYAHAEMGLGEALRNTAYALEAAAVPFLVRKLDVPLLNRQDNLSMQPFVAEDCRYAINCISINPDMLYQLPRWMPYREWGCRYNVGYWFWELANFPDAWRYACDLVDEVWVNTEFVAAAVRQAHHRVFKIPFAVEFATPASHLDRNYYGLPESDFLFLFSYDFNSSEYRKNPGAVIEAFKKAFQNQTTGVALVVKSINGERNPEALARLKESLQDDSRIIWVDGYLSTEEMRGLLRTADCYVSLHRAEGLGLGLAESMFLGKPVIGTAYSGNMEFMNDENSLLVPYRLIDVQPGEYHFSEGQQWADPDIDAAAECMRRVSADADLRKDIGAKAQTYMKAHHSLAVVSEALARRLADIDRDIHQAAPQKTSCSLLPVLTNSGWNMLGLLLPLVAAVIAIPMLIANLGTERFGVLSLVWVIIGYFALFDLGLGRAVTKEVSEFDQRHDQSHVVSVCVTAMGLAGVVGLFGGVLVLLIGYGWPGLTGSLPDAIQQEIDTALLWVGLCIPITVITAVLRGIQEGLQRFRVLNLIRGPMGALFYLLPALASYLSSSLLLAVATTVLARLLMLYANYLPCRKLLLWKRHYFSRAWLKPLFKFGGWLTLSNLVGSFMVYMDRFILAAVVPFSNLTFYTAPFEVVSKVLFLPAALTAALFPALNKHRVAGEGKHIRMKAGAQWLTFAVMFVVVISGVTFSQPLLSLWLGEAFAEQSAHLVQWLLLGFGFNALAQVTYVALQSEGKNRAVSGLQLLELPFYALLLWVLINEFGMLGAALAWAIRAIVDWLLLEVLWLKSTQAPVKADTGRIGV